MQLQVEELTGADERAYLEAVARSRAAFGEWVDPPSDADGFRFFLERTGDGRHRSLLIRTASRELVGCINLNEIVGGPFQSAYLGYYAFVPYVGKGLMRRGLSQVIDRAFGEWGLHRLEANIQPGNAASIGLVESLGFRREGFSPRYLRIAGEWRDHLRFAITREEW